jgi:hypothetical protein
LPFGAVIVISSTAGGMSGTNLTLHARARVAPVQFLINLKTAKALGLTVPLHLQQIAHEVVEQGLLPAAGVAGRSC